MLAKIGWGVKVFYRFLLLNLAREVQYRINFLFSLAIDFIGSVVLLIFYNVVYEHIALFHDWDKTRAFLFVGTYIIVNSLYVGLFFHSVCEIPHLIVSGKLDGYLTQPLSARVSLTLTNIDFGCILNALLAFFFVLFFLLTGEGSFSWDDFILYFFSMGLGLFFLYNAIFMLMTLAFWTGKTDELRDWFAQAIEFGNKPAFVYPKILRFVFYWIFPIFMVANMPMEFLWKEATAEMFVLAVLSSIVFYKASQVLWQFGLNRYSSASS